jgi:hypothetical protein
MASQALAEVKSTNNDAVLGSIMLNNGPAWRMYVVFFFVTAAMSEVVSLVLADVASWVRILLYVLAAVGVFSVGELLVDQLPPWLFNRAPIVLTLRSPFHSDVTKPSSSSSSPTSPPQPQSQSQPLVSRDVRSRPAQSSISSLYVFDSHPTEHDNTVFQRV